MHHEEGNLTRTDLFYIEGQRIVQRERQVREQEQEGREGMAARCEQEQIQFCNQNLAEACVK